MCLLFILKLAWTQGRVPLNDTYILFKRWCVYVSMVTETSGTRTGTLDSEYENIGIIPIYFVFHCPLGPYGVLVSSIWTIPILHRHIQYILISTNYILLLVVVVCSI